ncbi:guanylate kinase, partial [Streptomyces caniscabiei]|uniref:guanylate kinase n=1 Tax=Streptomyces caniscabiei TaxID=2746961 RepID=UPI0038F63C7F
MNVLEEIRHADVFPFKSCVLGIEDQEVATEYINAHRHAYCTARGDMFTISDLSRINRLSNMSTKESGKIVIISGPSCAGKDTLIDKWMSVQPKAKKAITCTTRQPREGEVNKVHYFFMSDDEFQSKVNEGNFFLEHMNVHGKWYGTPLSEIERLTKDGGFVVVRVDVQGGMEIM